MDFIKLIPLMELLPALSIQAKKRSYLLLFFNLLDSVKPIDHRYELLISRFSLANNLPQKLNCSYNQY